MPRPAWYYRLACALGLHGWHYLPNVPQGGRPVRRICNHCRRREQWNADAARAGRVVWERTPPGRS